MKPNSKKEKRTQKILSKIQKEKIEEERKQYQKHIARKDYRKNPSIKTGLNFVLVSFGIKPKSNK